MQDRPTIKTAIPKRRYHIGDFSATLLGEIESGDGRAYKYILAFVQGGQPQPSFYVCAERSPSGEQSAGRYLLRVINDLMAEVVDSDDKWGDLDAFAEQGLKLGAGTLGLQGEQVHRLM